MIKFPRFQFIIFAPLSYCFEDTIGFDVKASLAGPPVSPLIKTSDIIKIFKKRLFSSTGLFMD